jgi:hypothetical protein
MKIFHYPIPLESIIKNYQILKEYMSILHEKF